MVVNTSDGTVWLRRAETRGGLALYAPQDVCRCPEFVMATEAELAEHGITGSAYALPVPVGPVLRSELDQARDDVMGACLARWEEEQDNARLRLALASAKRGRSQLRAQVAELEAQRERRRVRLVALQNDALNMRGTLSPNGEDNKVPFTLGETLTPAVEWLINRVAELEAERHSTNEALDDAVQALRADRAEPAKGPSAAESADRWTALFAPTQALRVEAERPGACDACGSLPEQWCPDCAACKAGCHGGHVDNPCGHANAPWANTEAVPPRVQAMRALLDGQRAAVEDPHDGPLHHDYRVGRDMPETGGGQ
jgi:hypothetical protein